METLVMCDCSRCSPRPFTADELRKQEADTLKYEQGRARDNARREASISMPSKPARRLGRSLTKSCKLPLGTINYTNTSGVIPLDGIKEYGELILLGGRETDADGNIPLRKISDAPLPAAIGTLVLAGSAGASAGAGTGAVTGATSAAGVAASGVIAGALVGVVALLWPSSLGDSSLYTDEQLKSLKEGRTRVRLHIEQQADGTLKGYGYNTQSRRDWEMIPVVQFVTHDQQQVADFGDGIALIWTPAADTSNTLGIPALEAAPQAPQIWVYPPTERADRIIVNPIYPPEYKDFILVFPADSGIQPLYVVFNVQLEKNKAAGAAYEDKEYAKLSGRVEETAKQVTVKTQSGIRTRIDMMGKNSTGEIMCIECKASDTATLTRNQRAAFPEIETSGGIIVGKGKPGFPGGTVLPPTRVEILRPSNNIGE